MRRTKMKFRQKRMKLNHMNAFDYINYFFMAILLFITLYPLYYCVIVSISNGSAVVQGKVIMYPIGFSLDSYRIVFRNDQILLSYSNTLKYTTVGTIINILMTTMCAYPLSRQHLKGRHVLNVFILITMFISGGMIPLYLQVKRLDLIDKIWSVVLPGAINTYYMIIMRTFFSSIPEELHEAAHIDGASQIKTLTNIVLPLSKTIIATLILFYAVAHWNGYLSALLYLNTSSKFPLQIVLRNMVIDSNLASMTSSNAASSTESLVTESKLKYSIVIISILPMLIIYPIVQKYFTKGVMIGSVKG